MYVCVRAREIECFCWCVSVELFTLLSVHLAAFSFSDLKFHFMDFISTFIDTFQANIQQ